MNLYHLRYFVVLAQLEHYTNAAKELRITQPTLSHAISSLEQDLGITLFEKKGRNVALTKPGEVFRNDVEQALTILDSGIDNMHQLSKGEGHIDIALLRTLSQKIVPRLLRKFLDKYPDKHITFQLYNDTGMSQDLISGLKNRKYDLVFCSKITEEKDVTFKLFAKQDLVLIVPKGHTLEKVEKIDLVDTLPFPQIWFSKRSGMRPIIDNLFNDYKKKPIIHYEVEEDETIAGLVAQGFGIAIIPRMPLLKLLEVEVIEIAHPKWERLFYMAYLTDSYDTPVVQSFKNFIMLESNVIEE